MEFLKKFLKDEEGQGMAEYALILALVAIVVIVALELLGVSITGIFNRTASELGALPD